MGTSNIRSNTSTCLISVAETGISSRSGHVCDRNWHMRYNKHLSVSLTINVTIPEIVIMYEGHFKLTSAQDTGGYLL